MKVGEFYFRAEFDEETGKVEFDEYGCRTIRRNHVYLTRKESFTWGKRSTKNGDYGWLPHIPSWCRRKVLTDSDVADMYRPTKRGALAAALAAERKTKAKFKDTETQEYCALAIAAFTARLRRQK